LDNLAILYFIYLANGCGRVGGKVSILDVARWMRTTKPTVKKVLDKMVDNGILGRAVQFKNGREYRWEYWLTEVGQLHLDNHDKEAYQAYRVQVERVIEAIKASSNPAELWSTSKKNKRQEEAGQKKLL